MNGNRNRYTSAPLYGIKNKKVQKPTPQQQPQTPVQQPAPQQAPYNQAPYGQPYGQAPYGQAPQQPYGQVPPQGMYGQAPYGQVPYSQAPQQAYIPQQPQPVQTAPQPRRFGWLIGVVTLALPILFLVALILGNPIVHGVFIACALCTILFMLFAKPFSKNARYTLSLIYAALVVVIAAALIISLPAHESRQTSAGTGLDAQTLFGGDSALSSVSGTTQQTSNDQSDVLSNAPAVQATDAPVTSAAEIRLNAFMSYWAESQLDSMVTLCLPSWANNLENPKSELFILLANRTPLSYTVEKVSGSDADTSRTITLTVLIDKKSTSEPAYYQMQVLMLRINETWYVDPNSLGATKLSSTPQPGDTEAGTIPFVPTEAPTPEPTISANTLLYYNPEGGKYYHGTADCSSVDEQYLPLKAFNYSDLNNTTFKNLLACNKCDAPARPIITGN